MTPQFEALEGLKPRFKALRFGIRLCGLVMTSSEEVECVPGSDL